ncbi:MAG: hypothetical protein P1T08_08580 [Acidimicrobiia bacterium]|nr:hypothetical protein [Acidimicrobiia bacterium]
MRSHQSGSRLMSRPFELLRDAAQDEWADPVDTSLRAAEGLLELVDQDWAGAGLEAARMLRDRRHDQPLILAITERALDPDPERVRRGLVAAIVQLGDNSWSSDLGLRNAHHESLGVMSLGRSTLSMLEAAAQLGGSRAQLFTDRRAISKGLGYLNYPISVAPPEEAAALLAPGVASTASRFWTTSRIADAALKAKAGGRQIVVIVHPLAELSPLNRAVYRPHRLLIDVSL